MNPSLSLVPPKENVLFMTKRPGKPLFNNGNYFKIVDVENVVVLVRVVPQRSHGTNHSFFSSACYSRSPVVRRELHVLVAQQ